MYVTTLVPTSYIDLSIHFLCLTCNFIKFMELSKYKIISHFILKYIEAVEKCLYVYELWVIVWSSKVLLIIILVIMQ